MIQPYDASFKSLLAEAFAADIIEIVENADKKRALFLPVVSPQNKSRRIVFRRRCSIFLFIKISSFYFPFCWPFLGWVAVAVSVPCVVFGRNSVMRSVPNSDT